MRRRPVSSAFSSASALARARVAAGLSQAQLAERAGVCKLTVYYAEKGAQRPRAKTAAALAAALGRTVRDFWPLLADALEGGRLLDTVIPLGRALRRRVVRHRGTTVAYADPEGGRRVKHKHRPPICCGAFFCRCVELADPETYPVFGDPRLITFAEAGGVNG